LVAVASFHNLGSISCEELDSVQMWMALVIVEPEYYLFNWWRVLWRSYFFPVRGHWKCWLLTITKNQIETPVTAVVDEAYNVVAVGKVLLSRELKVLLYLVPWI
jgi:hypothetical protein